jgi:hypothetical protein
MYKILNLKTKIKRLAKPSFCLFCPKMILKTIFIGFFVPKIRGPRLHLNLPKRLGGT